MDPHRAFADKAQMPARAMSRRAWGPDGILVLPRWLSTDRSVAPLLSSLNAQLIHAWPTGTTLFSRPPTKRRNRRFHFQSDGREGNFTTRWPVDAWLLSHTKSNPP
jgi:hypothetical protein